MITNTRKVRIEWGDCDPAGIVYFPRYFAFFDDSTAALFEAAGLRKREMIRAYDIVGIPVVDVHAKFFIPSIFGEDVEIESSIGKWGRSSFEVRHRLLKNTELAVEGFETRVWVGRHPEKPDGIQARPIPKDVIDRFEKA
ncbi:MAG: acyl-CoA thioesterase [Steroidobacterales bacterium]